MPSRSTRGSKQKSNARLQQVPTGSVYSDLLAEAGPAETAIQGDERPLKRPRLAGSTRRPITTDVPLEQHPTPDARALTEELTIQPHQTTDDDNHNSAEDSFDEDNDLEFEDVALERRASTVSASEDSEQDINITLSPQVRTVKSSRRNQPSRIEKSVRVLAHKAHLVTLIGHCMIANSRCNDRVVQKRVKRLLQPSVRTLLRPDRDDTQFQRNHSLMNGLQRAMDAFKGSFRITACGMTRSVWREPDDSAAALSAGLDDAEFQTLRTAARTLSGSQDVGAQLFCAMLRSVGVVSRLVCSLQVLPLSNSQAKQNTPQKMQGTVALTVTPGRSRHDHEHSVTQSSPVTSKSKRTSAQRLSYPVCWTEVFDAAYQKWIPVDAVITHTIKKPAKLEPPASYTLNQMAYVIAFSADGAAKDVTRRYARSYNAKTRRLRVESLGLTDMQWLRRLLRIFQPTTRSADEADIEDAELNRREAIEGLPTNILDFVGHPVYALDRHLKRTEVIHPRRVVGKVNAGTSAKPQIEEVFRRQDVHTCRSADQWFRLGRIIKPGSQALKYVRSRRQVDDVDLEADGENSSRLTGLYSLMQTELYIPKPVSRGKVPRNGFGNIDVYVPSMIPRGGSHVRHVLAKQAADILEIDAVDAVVGFRFTGRKGAVVTEGAIISSRYLDAVNTVIDGLEWESVLQKCFARSLIALRLWKKFLQGCKIRARVAAYSTEGGAEHSETMKGSAIDTLQLLASHDDLLHTGGQHDENELVDLMKVPKVKAQVRPPRRVISDTSSGSEGDSDALGPSSVRYGKQKQGHTEHLDDDNERTTQADQTRPYSEDMGGFLIDDEDTGSMSATDSKPHVLSQQRPPNVDYRALEADESDYVHPKFERQNDDLKDLPNSPLQCTNYTHPATESMRNGQHIHAMSAPLIAVTARTARDTAKQLNTMNEVAHEDIREQSTDGEKGSRLSHDPDDEDVEPDWLESD